MALLLQQLLLSGLLLSLGSLDSVCQVGQLLLLHALPPSCVQLQDLHRNRNHRLLLLLRLCRPDSLFMQLSCIHLTWPL